MIAVAALSLCASQAPPTLSSAAVQASAQPARDYPAPRTDVPVVVPRVVARYPHDRTAFTEGLIWHAGALYESVGREGLSEVRRVRLADGAVTARATIPAAEFGEGLARWRGELVSLTWHDGVAHRWDAATLKRRGTSRYTGEGWGLASDTAGFVLSDGTPTLRFLDPATFAERRRITVTLDGRPLPQVNELEMVGDSILANIWHSGFLVRIDPADGRVIQLIDLRRIVTEVGARDPEAVANGIAWDPAGKRLFVTGKLWPSVYQIAVDPPSATPR